MEIRSFMLTYTFTDKGSDSLYEHLYKCIKNDILQGNLKAGEKLPSKRSLSKNLGISIITIENAYAQLMSEGYIYSLPKKGFYVTTFKEAPIIQHPTFHTDTISLPKEEGDYFADFTSNQTPPKYFPFSIWSKLLRELLNEKQDILLTNPPCGGSMVLRQAISEHLLEFRGLKAKPEQIIIGAGTEYLYGLIIQLLGMDKVYAVENPGYKKISMIYESHRVNCQSISMDQEGVLISELEEKNVNVIHTSPSHHFPTGIVMPVSRRYELLSWASKDSDRYIIEDDYDSEFRLSGQPIPTLQSIDVMEKVIYINTFTKTLASTIRISYMVLPKHLASLFYETLSFYSCTVSTFEQHTLAKFIQEGYFEKHINRMRTYYHGKKDQLISYIKNSALSKDVVISKEEAGLHFLMKINGDIDDEDFLAKTKQAGLKLMPLSAYSMDEAPTTDHTFVINYSSVPDEHMEEAISIIYRCLHTKGN